MIMPDKNFSVMRDLQGFFKKGERRALYNSAESLRDKVLIRMLWISGRRITEILDVKVHEIDFENDMISFHIGKKTENIKDEFGNKVRVKKDLVKLKPIDKFTSNLLKYYIEQYNLSKEDYLFKSDYAWEKNKRNKIEEINPITRQRAFQIIREISERAGIKKVGKTNPHPHHFRHSYAIDMAKKMKTPADVRKLQMILEHSNLGVTEQYLQFSDEELREMVENIGD